MLIGILLLFVGVLGVFVDRIRLYKLAIHSAAHTTGYKWAFLVLVYWFYCGCLYAGLFIIIGEWRKLYV